MNIFAIFARRTVHFFLKLASPSLPYSLPQTVGYEEAAAWLSSQKKKKALIVTGKTVHALSLTASLTEALQNAHMGYEFFDDVPADPTTECIESAYAKYLGAGCDCVIAIGGGSPMDCAKGVCGRVASPKRSLEGMRGACKIKGHVPPLLAIPTTAGTGSEATAAAVFTSPTHEKFAVFSFKIVPKLCVLDPALTLTLPQNVTADTGMDALTHAVEAYIGRAAGGFSRMHAEVAILDIFAWLPKAYADGGDLEARKRLLLAAKSAGVAFTLSYVGYVHALAHAVGGAYGIAHGRACAVLLPHVLRAYGKKAEKKLARLAVRCKLCAKKTPKAEAAQRFIAAIEALLRTLGMPEKLPVAEADLPMLAHRAAKEAFPYPVPKLLDEAALVRILQSVM